MQYYVDVTIYDEIFKFGRYNMNSEPFNSIDEAKMYANEYIEIFDSRYVNAQKNVHENVGDAIYLIIWQNIRPNITIFVSVKPYDEG